MPYKREVIEVTVSRQVLWVGTEAYPLQNIARAQTLTLVPNRAAAWRRFLKGFVLELILGFAAAVALRLATHLSTVQSYNTVHGVAVAVLVLVVVLVAISTIRLISRLSQGTYYALVIETAGTPRSVLVSDDQATVTKLVRQIMDAIDNPAAVYHTTVEKVDLRGAQGVQFGNYNTQDNTFTAR